MSDFVCIRQGRLQGVSAVYSKNEIDGITGINIIHFTST